MEQHFKDKKHFKDKLRTNSLSNKTTEYAYVSDTHHLLTLALNLPLQVQKIKTSLMRHYCLVHENVHAIEMGSWKEDEKNDLRSSLSLPKYVCSIDVLEFHSRREISKSSMPIMNKSSICLKEQNLFSIVKMNKICQIRRSNCWFHLN